MLSQHTKAVFSYLKWRDREGGTKAFEEKMLYLYYCCFKFLHSFCWDNHDNRVALSERRTIDFIFGVLERLEKFGDLRVEVPAQYCRRLTGAKGKVKLPIIILELLAEIIGDNSVANAQLSYQEHVRPAGPKPEPKPEPKPRTQPRTLPYDWS